MRHPVGLAVAALVLAVTLGVLVGLVIHTGMAERADGPPRPSTTANLDPPSSAGPSTSSSFVTPWQPSLTPVTDVPGGASGMQGASAVVDGAPAPETVTATVTAGSSTVPSTSAAPSPAATPHPTATPTPRTTAARSSTPRPTPVISRTTIGAAVRSTAPTSATARSGADAPGGACARLGEKSATATGATLYCQHDQTDGSLRWRPVTAGGGCLNRTMTGIGLDGLRYACREGAGGLNHWVRTG